MTAGLFAADVSGDGDCIGGDCVGICILGDALYACAPLMRICEGFGWDYIFTFKEGRTPTAYADARKLMDATPGQSGRLVRHEKHGGFGLEHNFCNKARASRNVYLLMQIAYDLWQLFNSGCLKRLGRGCRNMTQRKWAELILHALVSKGIALDLDNLPRRYISREFLTL